MTNQLVVPDSSSGQRIDNFLFRYFRYQSRTYIYKLIRSGQVRINSGRCKASSRLCEGDRVRLPPNIEPQTQYIPRLTQQQQQRILSCIIYQDDDFLVVDKPSGMSVHAGTGHNYGLVEALRACFSDRMDIELVHRIDRLTSGCVMVSKNAHMRHQLQQSWRHGEVNKTYFALVHGRWSVADRRVDFPLIVDRKSGLSRVLVHAHGKKSSTQVKVLGYTDLAGKTLSVLRLRPKTGRMHQLRVHCQSMGHAILGDPLYQNREEQLFCHAVTSVNRRRKAKVRMFLHAHSIELPRSFAVREFISRNEQWFADLAVINPEFVRLCR